MSSETFSYDSVSGEGWGSEVQHSDIVDIDEDGELEILLADQVGLSHSEICGCAKLPKENKKRLKNIIQKWIQKEGYLQIRN